MRKREQEMRIKYNICYTKLMLLFIVVVLWIMQPLFWKAGEEETEVYHSVPIAVGSRQVNIPSDSGYPESEEILEETLETSDGILAISPEEDYYKMAELIAKVVEAEAGNQGIDGKRMVADVILNRVKDEDFPDTVTDVIYQKNAFAVIANGMYEKVEVSEETWDAVYMELEEVGYPGLLYFCDSGFLEYGTPWRKIGDHYFSTK